jgi:hypothetical protein
VAHEAPAVEPFNAPMFRNLVERMQDDARRVVLDLGPARPETVASFGRFRCRLDIADLSGDIDTLNAISEPELLRQVVTAVLPPRRAEKSNVVLCWDLLNYLQPGTITALMREVRERLAPDALVHALIVYSGKTMAARPARIVPDDQDRLLYFPQSAQESPAPRYSPEVLARCMPGYAVERAMLLRNGMQEFLFRS